MEQVNTPGSGSPAQPSAPLEGFAGFSTPSPTDVRRHLTASGTLTGGRRGAGSVPQRVETTDPDGVDHTWVMQVTFVLTLAAGVPLVVGLSAVAELPTWSARAEFAVRVGAVVWLLTALGVYGYARWVDTD
jgi:hypothetical protein